MLRLDITGDTHPKTVKLVSDDADAELDQIREHFEKWEIEEGDDFRAWFDNASAEEIAAGVEIPTDHIGEFGDFLESAGWDDAAEQINKLREEGIADLERKMARG